MVVTVIVNHPTHVTFCITHLFLFETTLDPFAPVLYVRATAKKRGVPVEETHIARMVFPIFGITVLLGRRSQYGQLAYYFTLSIVCRTPLVKRSIAPVNYYFLLRS
jgi:hypothetical protein